MSEFPEWLERRKGPFWEPTYDEAQRIHDQVRAVYALIPDIEERLRVGPDRRWPWWRRCWWYVQHG